jgi:hypothetical protein
MLDFLIDGRYTLTTEGFNVELLPVFLSNILAPPSDTKVYYD